MWDRLKRILDFALLGSLLELQRASRIIQQKLRKCQIECFNSGQQLEHSKETLEAALNLSVLRLERIENKAMGTLLGISVAIAVLGATSGLLGSNGLLVSECYPLQVVGAVFLFTAMLYFIASGLLALEAYRVGEVYRPTLEDLTPVSEEIQEKMVFSYCIEQNKHLATLRSNCLSASFTCLRNGLVVVLMLGVLVIVVSILPGA